MPSTATIDDVLRRANELSAAMTAVIAAHDARTPQVRAADWAFYRYGTAITFVRDRAGGTAVVTLARGLLEEAALWDWSIASGVGPDWVARATAIEYQRVASTAQCDDDVWIGWLLPPGVNVDGVNGEVPSASEAVKRLGHGLDAAVLAPLSFDGLFGAYRLLELVSHGSPAAALVLRTERGVEVPAALAAASIQIAGAGAAAIIGCHLSLRADERHRLEQGVAVLCSAAARVHRIPVVRKGVALRAAKSRSWPTTSATSMITRLPPATTESDGLAREFLACAGQLQMRVADLGPIERDGFAQLAAATYDLANDHLRVVAAIVNGTLARAMLPNVARALFEEGCRWRWLVETFVSGAVHRPGQRFVGEARHHVAATREALGSRGVPAEVIDELLGYAQWLLGLPDDGLRLPSNDEMLDVAYPTAAHLQPAARPIYSILSQFVHATPLATAHLQRDEFTSLSAPTYAVALDGTCRGFLAIVTAVLDQAFGSRSARVSTELHALTDSIGRVWRWATGQHFLD